jgi:hypothetical protein
LFQEQFETVTTVYVVNKEYAFALDKAEFQDYVGEEKLVNFGASSECSVSGDVESDGCSAYRTKY